MEYRRCIPLIAGLAIGAGCGGADGSPASDGVWLEGPRLPAPVANNAVAAVEGPEGVVVFSFLGMDSTKVWSGVTTAAYRWDVGSEEGWRAIEPVPGPGRLAAAVQVVGGRIFLIGGYTVGEDGSEHSVPDVNVYDPVMETWSRVADMPLPVDDAVSGLWRDSLIFLVSGWHDTGNVSDVQIYDPTEDLWSAATPIPGAPVFGHTGAIAGDEIIYVGGAKIVDGRPRFVVDSAAWRGRIDPANPTKVAWEAVARPPGSPTYRAAGASFGGFAVFLGGAGNPYNYNGIGYDGAPSSPRRQLLAYHPQGGWIGLLAPPIATMDHRSLGVAGGLVFLAGGMLDRQQVSDRVWYAKVDTLLAQVIS